MPSTPRYGDGKIYEGECVCCEGIQRGPIARSRPEPYIFSDMFSSTRVRCVMISAGLGHDVPLADVRVVEEVES